MPPKKTKRKARQRRRQAASKLQQLQQPKRYWLKRKARMALWRAQRVRRASWKYLRVTWKVFVGTVALIVTVLGLYQVLMPRLSISQVAPLDPSDAFTARMAITNSGYFSLYDVNVRCYVNDATGEYGSGVQQSVIISSASKIFAEIRPDESATVRCPVSRAFPIVPPLQSADIELEFEYRPEYFFWRRSNRFRFITARAADGTLRWIEQPPLPLK